MRFLCDCIYHIIQCIEGVQRSCVYGGVGLDINNSTAPYYIQLMIYPVLQYMYKIMWFNIHRLAE